MEERYPNSDAEIPNRSGECAADSGRAMLKPGIIEDPVLGIPVLSFGDDAPVLTSEEVQDLLSDFP